MRLALLILVALMGVAAQESAPPPPEQVLQMALEAQGRGDIETMLSFAALDLFPEKNVEAARQILGVFRDNLGIANLSFTEQGVFYSDKGNVAVVRAEVSFTLFGPEDYNAPDANGIAAVLILRDGAWKIACIEPDSLLDQEILDRERGEVPQHKAGSRSAALTPAQANQALRTILKGSHFDEAAYLKDLAATFGGMAPLVGDATALVVQSASTGSDAVEAWSEINKNGVSGIGLAKVTQVAVGAIQIVTEPIPVLDTAFDIAGMWISQAPFDAEVKRGCPADDGLSARWLPAFQSAAVSRA